MRWFSCLPSHCCDAKNLYNLAAPPKPMNPWNWKVHVHKIILNNKINTRQFMGEGKEWEGAREAMEKDIKELLLLFLSFAKTQRSGESTYLAIVFLLQCHGSQFYEPILLLNGSFLLLCNSVLRSLRSAYTCERVRFSDIKEKCLRHQWWEISCVFTLEQLSIHLKLMLSSSSFCKEWTTTQSVALYSGWNCGVKSTSFRE